MLRGFTPSLFAVLVVYLHSLPAWATTEIFVHPEGDDDDPGDGSFERPYATLSKALDTIPSPADDDYDILLRGGTYWNQQTDWTAGNLDGHLVRIQGYEDEIPLFDGRVSDGSPQFPRDRWLLIKNGQRVEVRNVWIRNYLRWGLKLEDSGNILAEECHFEKIGNKGWTGSEKHYGLGVIHLDGTNHSTFRNNKFVHIENLHSQSELVHAGYVAHSSVNNTFSGNFVEYCSGDPFKIRDRSHENSFVSNYTSYSGDLGFLNSWSKKTTEPGGEADSEDTILQGNVALFHYPNRRRENLPPFEWCGRPSNRYSCDATPLSDPTGILYATLPDSEEIQAMTSADTGGDGTEELYVAIKYDGPEGDFVKVVRTLGDKDSWLSDLVYLSPYFNISAMTGGDFDGDGYEEVLTAFESPSKTEVWSGDGDGGLAQTLLYRSSGCSTGDCFRVLAMASGNFDGSGGDESATAFRWTGTGKDYLYRGNGESSVTSQKIWDSSWEDIAALAGGNFDGDQRDELVTAFHANSRTRLAAGNGYTSASDIDWALYLDSGTNPWRVTALTARRADLGPEELYLGMHLANVKTRVYRMNWATTDLQPENIYSDASAPFWQVRALGRRSRALREELITGLGYAEELTYIAGGNESDYNTYGDYYFADTNP